MCYLHLVQIAAAELICDEKRAKSEFIRRLIQTQTGQKLLSRTILPMAYTTADVQRPVSFFNLVAIHT